MLMLKNSQLFNNKPLTFRAAMGNEVTFLCEKPRNAPVITGFGFEGRESQACSSSVFEDLQSDMSNVRHAVGTIWQDL